MDTISFKRHRFPPEIIRRAVWLYARFTLSYRDVEDLLAERGLDISYESVRRCADRDIRGGHTQRRGGVPYGGRVREYKGESWEAAGLSDCTVLNWSRVAALVHVRGASQPVLRKGTILQQPTARRGSNSLGICETICRNNQVS